MKRIVASGLAVFIATTGYLQSSASAFDYGKSWPPAWRRHVVSTPHSFQRIATLPNYVNNGDPSDETVSEIVTVTQRGKTLVYTDGALNELGFVDISDPHTPLPTGKLSVAGEPTSVAALRDDLVLAAVNTSTSFTEPDGYLAVVDVENRSIVAELPLGGQPDSIAVSPDGQYAAIVIENERDEDVEVGGVEGGLPQAPAGYLVVVDVAGPAAEWTMRQVDLTGLAAYAPQDPEPEFVDINPLNQAVVSLQENNHLVVVDLPSATVLEHFSAGTQTLVGIDKTEDDVISLTETLSDLAREPDAVTWAKHGRRQVIATANEGDLFGGSRGFSLFSPAGDLLFDSGSLLEEIAVRYGHYPEHRSGNKGNEPESVTYARFGHRDLLFVGSERGSFVAVFELRSRAEPEFVQILPGPLGPEGILAIPSRGLLVVSGEEDDPTYGVRSSMMVYQLERGQPNYPHLLSADDEHGKPIAWSALSGMVALPGSRNKMLAVSDSAYAESRVFTVDAARKPAVVTDAIPVVGGTGDYDAEGIAVAPDGTYWIASEGNESGSRPNRLLQLESNGTVLREVRLPEAIEHCRAASSARDSLGSGFEGVAIAPRFKGYALVVAQQRGWNYTTPECEDLDDDPFDVDAEEPGWTRLWVYNPFRDTWSHIAYELEPVPQNASWVGLSEITALPHGFLVIERDNRSGDFASLKTLVKLTRGDIRDGRVTRNEKQTHDLLAALSASHGWITDKPEGVAVTANNRVFLVTDNDAVDDWSGETWFLSLGRVGSLFQ